MYIYIYIIWVCGVCVCVCLGNAFLRNELSSAECPQLWRGIRSLGNVSLRHMSNTELLKNIIIFKFCSFKTCVEFITKNAFNPLIKRAVRMTVFPHFCSGEEAEDAKALALKLQKYGVQTIIDHSVEELESPDALGKRRSSSVCCWFAEPWSLRESP